MRPYVSNPGTSAAVTTDSTPGMDHAGAGSMRTIRAYGCGDRSVAPHSAPSRGRSDEKRNSPCAFGTPSGRGTLSPIRPVRTGVSVLASDIGTVPASCHGSDRVDQPPVPRAATDVARELLADLGRRRLRDPVEQRVSCHHQAGRAE